MDRHLFGQALQGGGSDLVGLGGGRGFGLVILAIILFEVIWRLWIARRGYDGLAAATTLGVAIGHSIAEGFSRIVWAGVYFAVWKATPLHLPLNDWRIWMIGFFAVEFVYYWYHRWSHEIRWLWASHSVHHSATELTLPSALRLPWTHLISGAWLIYIPLVVLGFHPVMVLSLLALDLFYQFFLHTETVPKLGPIEWVMNTPSHHRVHHGMNAQYLDKNYGGMVIFYDRLFGTFQEELKDEPIRYGLLHGTNSKNPFVVAFEEWVRMFRDAGRAKSVNGLWTALFGRPGAVAAAAAEPETPPVLVTP